MNIIRTKITVAVPAQVDKVGVKYSWGTPTSDELTNVQPEQEQVADVNPDQSYKVFYLDVPEGGYCIGIAAVCANGVWSRGRQFEFLAKERGATPPTPEVLIGESAVAQPTVDLTIKATDTNLQEGQVYVRCSAGSIPSDALAVVVGPCVVDGKSFLQVTYEGADTVSHSAYLEPGTDEKMGIQFFGSDLRLMQTTVQEQIDLVKSVEKVADVIAGVIEKA